MQEREFFRISVDIPGETKDKDKLFDLIWQAIKKWEGQDPSSRQTPFMRGKFYVRYFRDEED